MSKKSEREEEQREARANLKKLLKPGQDVYCVLRHVSASGMSRVIDLLITVPQYEHVYPLKADGRTDYDAKPKRKLRGHGIRSIGYLASKAGVGSGWDSDRQGLKMGGCGMDMGFAAVYELGQVVWPKGTPKPHGKRNGEPDNAGGYALKKVWL